MAKPENTQSGESDKEDSERHLILRIARKAVEDAEIPERTPFDIPESTRWEMSYQELEDDIALSISLNLGFTRGVMHLSIGLTAMFIFREVNELFSNPKARASVRFEESEFGDEVFELSVRLLVCYITYLPTVQFHSINQALRESIISYIKKIAEYDLRRDWEEEGEKLLIDLLPNNELTDICRLFPDTIFQLVNHLEAVEVEYSAYRKASYSNRKAFFNEEAFRKLSERFETLRLGYKKAKKQFKIKRQAFFEINNNATLDQWKEYWEDYCGDEFNDLFAINALMDLSPSDFAYQHLAVLYGFSRGYMAKLVSASRKKQS